MLPKPKRKRKKKPPNPRDYAKEYCQYCGGNNMLEVHHIQNKGMGGASDPAIHHPDNLITLCRYHHDCAHRKVRGEYLSPDGLHEAKQRNEGTGSW